MTDEERRELYRQNAIKNHKAEIADCKRQLAIKTLRPQRRAILERLIAESEERLKELGE